MNDTGVADSRKLRLFTGGKSFDAPGIWVHCPTYGSKLVMHAAQTPNEEILWECTKRLVQLTPSPILAAGMSTLGNELQYTMNLTMNAYLNAILYSCAYYSNMCPAHHWTIGWVAGAENTDKIRLTLGPVIVTCSGLCHWRDFHPSYRSSFGPLAHIYPHFHDYLYTTTGGNETGTFRHSC
jgi:hypothetical protein